MLKNSICILLLAILAISVASIFLPISIFSGCAMHLSDKEYPPITYTGDGDFIDHGRKCSHTRFVLKLGEIDLTKVNSRQYKIEGLPETRFSTGLVIRTPYGSLVYDLGEKPIRKCSDAKVEMTLKDVEGTLLFKISDLLQDYVWTNGSPENNTCFVYGSSSHNVKYNNDKMRNTFFKADPSKTYYLNINVLVPSKDRTEAAVYASGGGWKVE